MKTYTFGTNPQSVQFGETYYDEALLRAAGVDPDDEEYTCTTVLGGLPGVPAGTPAVVGMTCEGHQFFVLETAKKIRVWRVNTTAEKIWSRLHRSYRPRLVDGALRVVFWHTDSVGVR